MSSDSNPFAAPTGDPVLRVDSTGPGPWRRGPVVLADSGSVWPRRCVKCGSPDVLADPISVRLVYVPLWVYLLLPVGVLVYVIVRWWSVRYGAATFFLCRQHFTLRRVIRLGTPLGLVAFAVGGLAASAATDLPLLSLVPLVTVVAAFVLLPAEIVRARAIAGTRIELAGAADAFLDTLPLWEEVRVGAFVQHADIPDIDD